VTSSRLVLFDVDGTLVSARGAGREAIGRALRAVFGATGPIDAYDFRGKTDPRIVRDLMREAGVSEAVVTARLTVFYDAYVRELEGLIGGGSRLTVMPGVVALIRALSARADVVVGLLTGNIEAGARAKLRPTGLWEQFRVGAFGSDDIDRRHLPAIACARAQAGTGRDFPFSRVIIVGDTPLDIDCARACGAVAVAVATGQHARHELSACAPDHLFGDLSDVERVVAALAGP